MDYGFILFPFKNFSFAMTLSEIFLPNPPPYFGTSQASNSSKFQPLLNFISIYFDLKSILVIFLNYGGLQRDYQFSFESWSQINFPD